MSEYLTVWRVSVKEDDMEALLRDQPKAIGFTKNVTPELLSGELVKLNDDRWLHILRWSDPDGLAKLRQRLEGDPENAAKVGMLHSYIAQDEMIGNGQVLSHA